MKYLGVLFLLIWVGQAIAQNAWTQLNSMPAEGRHRTTGFSIGNKGYVGLGHYNSGPAGNIAKADIWEYDPGSNSWTQKADYGYGATYGAVAFTIGNKAYVGAHVYGSSQFFAFDPIANSWSLIAPVPGGSSDQTAFALGDKGYFVSPSTLYEYDAVLDTWTQKAFTPVSVSSWSKSFVVDDKAYLLTASGSLYEYKQSNNSWLSRAYFPGESIGGWTTMEMNGKGYVATGYVQFLSPTSRECWEYDPATNSWQQMQDLPGATRRFASSFSINNKGYVCTGTSGTNMSDLWVFDALLSTPELKESIEIEIYPNPSTDYITVKCNTNNELKIKIFNAAGELVLKDSKLDNEQRFHKSDLGTGLFIYAISDENGNLANGKFIFN